MEMGVCPTCRYCLRGLSEPIRCPECGLQLGFDPLIFRASGNLWLVLALAWALSAIVILILLVRNGREPVLYCWVAIMSLGSFGSLVHWRRARSRFLIVSATEVKIFHGNIQTDVIPLDAQTEARWDWITGRIIFQRSGTDTGASFMPPARRSARAILRSIEGRRRGTV